MKSVVFSALETKWGSQFTRKGVFGEDDIGEKTRELRGYSSSFGGQILTYREQLYIRLRQVPAGI